MSKRRLLLAAGCTLMALLGLRVVVGIDAASLSAKISNVRSQGSDTINISKGVWILSTDAGLTLEKKGARVQLIPIAQMAPGKSFGHDDTRKGGGAYCGGEIRERIKNDGRRLLRCEECKQEWEETDRAKPLP